MRLTDSAPASERGTWWAQVGWAFCGAVLAALAVFALHLMVTEAGDAAILAGGAGAAAASLGLVTFVVLDRIHPTSPAVCVILCFAIGLENDAVMAVAGITDTIASADGASQVLQSTFDFIMAGTLCCIAGALGAAVVQGRHAPEGR